MQIESILYLFKIWDKYCVVVHRMKQKCILPKHIHRLVKLEKLEMVFQMFFILDIFLRFLLCLLNYIQIVPDSSQASKRFMK